ncbi:MAG: Ig-like domain-containing protein, partial [Planctomycetota bacterium]|nr:Ig-like domain-containing protein [Planctomycetota bacterium]
AVGQSSVTVNLAAVDDSIVDGTQTVTITASATGFTNGSDTLQVTDNDGDVIPPTITSLLPADNATGVVVGTNLVITFNENVQKGDGNIVVKKTSDNSTVETIAVSSAAVTISGVTATIDPATTLAASTGYYVEVAAGALEDLSGNDFAGITGATAWNFTTSSIPGEIRAELRIVSVPAAADRMGDATFAAYTSLSSVPVSSPYYAEVWLRDTGTLRGIAGGAVDLSYTTAPATTTAIDHGGVYTVLPSGTTDDANGLVDNLGGGTFNAGEGTTQWVRLGTTTFQGTAAGAVTFTLGHDLSPGAANSNFAEVGAGNLDWSLVQFPAASLTLQQVQGNVEVYLVPRLVKSAVDTSTSLPASERSPFWALEGSMTPGVNDFYVEVWVRSDPANAAGISGGSVNISFDPRYARAAAIDHGSIYTLLPVESINNTTGVVSLGGGTLAADKGRDGYVLLGRVEFQGNAPVDEVAHQAGPFSVALASAAGPKSFAEVGLGNVDATFKPIPTTNVKAVIYDIDDSGAVDFGDFSYFVPAFGKPVGGTEPPYKWWADFDASGTVDFGDFSYFVTAFGKAFNDLGIKFPSGGQGLLAANDAASGEAEGLVTAPLSTTVVPEIQAELRLVTTPATADHLSDASFASYASISAVPVNSTYYGEVWLRDTGTIRGIAGGSLDLAYTTAEADAAAIDHSSVFNVLTSGTIDDINGLVDNLGGGTFSGGEGTAQWVRLATMMFTSTAAGDVTFLLDHDSSLGASNPNFAEVGAGSIDWSLIHFNGSPTTLRQLPLRAWCNPMQAEDVNGDGRVSPLDVLIIINHINAVGAGPLPMPPPNLKGPPLYLDVNGDDSATAIDVLMVINLLNQRASEANAGEGESASPPVVDIPSQFAWAASGPATPFLPKELFYAKPSFSKPEQSRRIQGIVPAIPAEIVGQLKYETILADGQPMSAGACSQNDRRHVFAAMDLPRLQQDTMLDDLVSAPRFGELDDLIDLLANDVAAAHVGTNG